MVISNLAQSASFCLACSRCFSVRRIDPSTSIANLISGKKKSTIHFPEIAYWHLNLPRNTPPFNCSRTRLSSYSAGVGRFGLLSGNSRIQLRSGYSVIKGSSPTTRGIDTPDLLTPASPVRSLRFLAARLPVFLFLLASRRSNQAFQFFSLLTASFRRAPYGRRMFMVDILSCGLTRHHKPLQAIAESANPVDIPRNSGCLNRLGCVTVIVPNAW